MKKFTIFLLLVFISLFSFNINVTAKEINKVNNYFNILDDKYKFDKDIKPKKIDEKVKKTDLKCDDVKFLHDYWVVIEIAAPILLIVFGSADFLIAVIASDEQKMKKAISKFPKRMIAALLVFLVFTIVQILVGISQEDSVKDTSLIKCIVSGK